MMVRWKNKNPYLNFYRETKRVVLSKGSDEAKITVISQMITRNYIGDWLFSHPSHKYLGNGVPQPGDDVSQNPYYLFLNHARSVLRTQGSASEKISKITEELSWMSEDRLQDWAYTA